MITFFLNKEKGTYPLVDPVKKTLNHINSRDYWTFYYYSHLVPQQVITIPDYPTLVNFRKALLSATFLNELPADQIPQAIVDHFPEYFL